jgi:hypothetical protein
VGPGPPKCGSLVDSSLWLSPIATPTQVIRWPYRSAVGRIWDCYLRLVDSQCPSVHHSEPYRVQLFIGISVSEAAALAGFVGSFVMGTWWICLVGQSFATIGLTLIGPSRREIARRQDWIASQGSSPLLGKALMETPPRG